MRRIPYADYRVNQLIPVMSEQDFKDSNHVVHPEHRLFRKRYGIKIEFHQSGRLGEKTIIVSFSFGGLLFALKGREGWGIN